MQNSLSLSARNDVPLAQNDVRIAVEEKDGVQTVSARELYEKLEITDRFSRWFDSLLKYGFVENADFTSVKTSTLVNNGATRELLDYAITIEMAKQICMLQRSEKGRAYREYFLRLEKAWNTPEAVMSRALQIANRTLEDAKRQIDIQQAQIAQMKPSADSWETYAGDMKQRSREKSFREVAKLLGLTPQKSLIKWFFDNGYIMRGREGWTATQKGIQSGMVVNRIITGQNGHAGEQCKVTTFGMLRLSHLKNEGMFDTCIMKERVFGEKRPRNDYRRNKGANDVNPD